MRDLAGRVAVVTGAASGIGRGLAARFAREGMKVVIADVEQSALETAEKELAADGHEVLAAPADVSQRESVELLAEAVWDRFGACHVLCNNAGVSGGGAGAIWDATEKDWQWVLGVNLMGVVHGIQSFVPRMVASGEEGHIVNTSSVLGVVTGPGSVYGVSKHAVTRLSEGLYYDLSASGAPIGVSVLCPGLIATNIVSSERNRPVNLRNTEPAAPAAQERRNRVQSLFLERGMPPDEVADVVVRGIFESRFYIFTHPEFIERVSKRFNGIIEGQPPDQPPRGEGGLLSSLTEEAKRS